MPEILDEIVCIGTASGVEVNAYLPVFTCGWCAHFKEMIRTVTTGACVRRTCVTSATARGCQWFERQKLPWVEAVKPGLTIARGEYEVV